MSLAQHPRIVQPRTASGRSSIYVAAQRSAAYLLCVTSQADRYTDIVSDRTKVENGEYLGTIGGVRVRFVNAKCRQSVNHSFVSNWNAYRVDTGKQIAEAWNSRLGAALAVANQIRLGRVA